jgi:hypothetical protein
LTIISENLRRQVIARAGGRCEYCRLPVDGQVATFPVDHVVPRTRNGHTVLSNLALACPHCNAHKWAFTDCVDPDTGQVTPLFNPREHDWTEHFAYSTSDGTILQGNTSMGRATVDRLQMNSPTMLVIRRLLIELSIPLV